MSRTPRIFMITLCALMLTLAAASQSRALEMQVKPPKAVQPEAVLTDPAMRREVHKILTQIKEIDKAKLVVMKNGAIYSVRAPRTADLLGIINLWHCYDYLPISRANIQKLLGARVVGAIGSADYPQVAATYDMQCMDEKADRKLIAYGVIAIKAIAIGAVFF